MRNKSPTKRTSMGPAAGNGSFKKGVGLGGDKRKSVNTPNKPQQNQGGSPAKKFGAKNSPGNGQARNQALDKQKNNQASNKQKNQTPPKHANIQKLKMFKGIQKMVEDNSDDDSDSEEIDNIVAGLDSDVESDADSDDNLAIDEDDSDDDVDSDDKVAVGGEEESDDDDDEVAVKGEEESDDDDDDDDESENAAQAEDKSDDEVAVPAEQESDDDDSEDASDDNIAVKSEEDSDDEEDRVAEEDSDDETLETKPISTKKVKPNQKKPKKVSDIPKVKVEGKKYTMFVKNIPYQIKKEELHNHFKSIPVNRISIPTDLKTKKGRGFAFVEVSSEANREKILAMNDSQLNGRVLSIVLAERTRKRNANKRKLEGDQEIPGNKKVKQDLGDKKEAGKKFINKKNATGKPETKSSPPQDNGNNKMNKPKNASNARKQNKPRQIKSGVA